MSPKIVNAEAFIKWITHRLGKKERGVVAQEIYDHGREAIYHLNDTYLDRMEDSEWWDKFGAPNIDALELVDEVCLQHTVEESGESADAEEKDQAKERSAQKPRPDDKNKWKVPGKPKLAAMLSEGTMVEVMMGDEVPQVGSGRRFVEILKVGRKWMYIRLPWWPNAKHKLRVSRAMLERAIIQPKEEAT